MRIVRNVQRNREWASKVFRLFIIFSFVSRYFRSVVRPYYDNIRFGRWVICPPPNGFVLVRFRSPRAIFPPFLLFSLLRWRFAWPEKQKNTPFQNGATRVIFCYLSFFGPRNMFLPRAIFFLFSSRPLCFV